MMIKYIIKDIAGVLRYLPYGLAAGIVVVIILSGVNQIRVRKNKSPFCVPAITGYIMYLVVLLFITFLSREDSSRKTLDLELFSSWGINNRNNAFVVENILLFVPYGFLSAWVIKEVRNVIACTMLGAATSLLIEWMQLLTGRGIFQIDDVITNTIGTTIGYLICRIFKRPPRKN